MTQTPAHDRLRFSVAGWNRCAVLRRLPLLLVVAAAMLLTACQPPVRLMPSPLSFTDDETPVFTDNKAARNAPEIPIFYATNRQVLMENVPPVYTIFPGDELRMGIAHLRVGDGTLNWKELNALSRSPDPANRPAIKLKELEELAVLGESRDDPTSAASQDFFARINAALAQSRHKNLIVYVHGANNAVHRATGQAAQFQHFTGRDAVVLTFIWPSAERVRTYFTDIRHARASVPVFSHLLAMLADHTDAQHIDVLAYSAGAEVASAGLAELGSEMRNGSRAEMKRRLKLGQIYFAAPDVDTRGFVDDLEQYVDLADRVSLSANLNDFTLAAAAIRHRGSRAGRPDPSELSDEQTQLLVNASNRYGFDLINVDPRVVPGMNRRSHTFWYSNPWVSNDLLAAFTRRHAPQQRGLDARATTTDIRYWVFPQDYDQRVRALLRASAKQAP
ncbi:alpha/beta hydrolase [Luteimonas cucumeris]|nr:alpha/beta hydrolase [Luteimonas cucumeris]